ncbi:MAG TPA: hypothetical protein VK154_00735 [Chitinophagales bacterium]|nr:hypothetical protein [Chitinophagales bacterium]
MKEILLTLFYLILFNFLLYRFKRLQFKSFKPIVTNVLFNLKFLVGIFIWFVYTFYYKDVQNNDIHKFYKDALIINEVAYSDPAAFAKLMVTSGENTAYTDSLKNWNRNFDEAPINENRTIIRLNALLMFFTFKTYFAHILFFCFISLIGWVLMANAVMNFTSQRNALFALPVLLLPSVLFWASGVMKEPLLVFGLGLLIHGLLNLRMKSSSIAAIAIGFIIVLFTKFFVLACLFPAASAYLLFPKRETTTFIIAKYAVVFVVLLLAAFNIQHIVPRINPLQMLVNKQTNSVKEATYFKAGSRIDIPPLQPSASSVLMIAPAGILNTIARPYPTEAKNVMMLASAAENILAILLLIVLLWFTSWRSAVNINLLMFLLAFSLAYFALIGICTPVLGNLVRYRVPLLPLFMFAFILNASPRAIPAKLNWLLRM